MDCGIPFCNNGCPVNNIIPDWNDLVYRGNWEQALEVLHSTNNFPEFTGRICPAPCEAACTLNINTDPVGIKSIEHAIIDKGWERAGSCRSRRTSEDRQEGRRGRLRPGRSGRAQQLARVGHDVTVFEKNDRVGGLLRYGIPDFKMEKSLIDRASSRWRPKACASAPGGGRFARTCRQGHRQRRQRSGRAEQLQQGVRCGGPGRRFRSAARPAGSGPRAGRRHFALEFLIPQNKQVAGGKPTRSTPRASTWS
jgi:glutamate synthase (NADPH/NADH) small chain